MKNKKIILSSILSLVLCLSVIAGATFALFTSESGVNVAINSGKVEVVAYAENLDLYSPTRINTDGTVDNDTNAATETTFTNGGTATITDGNEIVLDRMTPGDKVTFEIVVENNSNVTIQYQTKIALVEGIDLFSGLKVTLEKDRVSTEYDGMTAYSQWATLSATGEVERTAVTIELPTTAGKEYQGLSCRLAFSVSAVQGNTYTEQPEENTVYIYNATDLLLFAKSVNNGNGYSGQTVKLMDDIDLAGIEWKPIGQTTGGYSARTYFQGTFDGNGKTISNMTIGESSWEAGSNGGENFATGFFGFIDAGGNTIKNVTFDNANVEGHHWVGVVAGYMTGTVENVVVKNSTVTSTYKNDKADGDKAGGVVGYLNSGSSVTGCTVTGSTITAIRDCGSVVGYSVGTVTGNTAQDCTVYYSTDNDAQIGGEIAGKRANGVSDNTANNVTVVRQLAVATAEQLSAALNATYSVDTTILLTDNINLADVAWGAHALNGSNNAQLTIDGNGKTISNLTSYTYAKKGGFNSNGLVTSIGAGFSRVVFKNLTVANATLTNDGGESAATGVFVGDTNTVEIAFDNCTVTGAKIDCYKWAGGFIGYAQDVYTVKKTITFTNCNVIDSVIDTTDSSAAGFVGHSGTNLNISGCHIAGNTAIKCEEDRSGTNAKAGYLIGTAAEGSVVIGSNTVDNTVKLVTMGGTTYDTTRYIGRILSSVTVSGVTVNS